MILCAVPVPICHECAPRWHPAMAFAISSANETKLPRSCGQCATGQADNRRQSSDTVKRICLPPHYLLKQKTRTCLDKLSGDTMSLTLTSSGRSSMKAQNLGKGPLALTLSTLLNTRIQR